LSSRKQKQPTIDKDVGKKKNLNINGGNVG
jgi:hypothetical protein